MTTALENELAKLDAARVASQDRETVDSIINMLEPDELVALAKRLSNMAGTCRLKLVEPTHMAIEAERE